MEQVNYWALLLSDGPKRYKVNHEIYGQTFDRLTVVSKVTFKKDIQKEGYHCFASCSCGSGIKSYRINSLKQGHSQSCGCKHIDDMKSRRTHGLSDSPVYMVWRGMLSRCYNPDNFAYSHYGLRGILVDDLWKNDVTAFHDWAMNNGYQKGLEIDRIDVDGIYTPDNCRFVTPEQNNRNTRGYAVSTSRYKGVCWDKNAKKWRAAIGTGGEVIYLGCYSDEKQAALVYNEAAQKYFGEHAYLNKFNDEEKEG